MKYPNPTFLRQAVKIKNRRRFRAWIIAGIIVFVFFAGLFVYKISEAEKIYEEIFPDLVGEATAESSSTSDISDTAPADTDVSDTSDTTAPPETSSSSPETTTSADTSSDSDATTAQRNEPDTFTEAAENTYFLTVHPLQTVTHDTRDQLLDDLKQDISDYISETSDTERICVSYISLSGNESFGVNDILPVVPAGAYALPVELAYYEMVGEGIIYPYTTAVLSDSDLVGDSSYIGDTYTAGKQFYLRSLAYYAAAYNDNAALNLLMDSMGGTDAFIPYISAISSYTAFTDSVTYTDYSGAVMRGTGRSTVYDLSRYAEALYFDYLNEPELFQPFINDLSSSTSACSFTPAFGSDALILHRSGRNEELHAYTELAIIDCDEPIVLCVYCECSDYDRACTIQADIASYVAAFISDCHTEE